MKKEIIKFLVLAMLAIGGSPAVGAIWQWSVTASNNATADPAINWAEGMSPSSVNDSARSMMAMTAAWRNDISAFIAAGGTAAAYTVTSFSGYSTSANTNGQMISFLAPATNSAGVTLNVDGVGAFPLWTDSTGTVVPAGAMIGGGIYKATFYTSRSAWVLHGFFASTYNIALGGYLESSVSTAPNSNFLPADGRCISRTTYAAYFSQVSTTYGACDGTTTFGIPDRVGRVPAMIDTAGLRLSNVSTGCGSSFAGLGATCANGTQSKTLVTLNLPPYTPSGSVSTTLTLSATVNGVVISGGCSGCGVGGGGPFGPTVNAAVSFNTATASSSFAGSSQGGASQPVPSVQPTYGVNVFVRVL